VRIAFLIEQEYKEYTNTVLCIYKICIQYAVVSYSVLSLCCFELMPFCALCRFSFCHSVPSAVLGFCYFELLLFLSFWRFVICRFELMPFIIPGAGRIVPVANGAVLNAEVELFLPLVELFLMQGRTSTIAKELFLMVAKLAI
jgi:hypothetical protein